MKKSEKIEEFCRGNVEYIKERKKQDAMNIDYLNGMESILRQIIDTFFEGIKQ